MTEMEVAATCIAVNLDVFRLQYLQEREADFGEPCLVCPLNKGCNHQWLPLMQPALKYSAYRISMGVPEHCYKPGNHENRSIHL